jgi:hypothetical protein
VHDQVFLDGFGAAGEFPVIEAEPHHFDDLLDILSTEGFCGHGFLFAGRVIPARSCLLLEAFCLLSLLGDQKTSVEAMRT